MAWGGLGLTTTRDVRQGYVQLIKCIANGGTFTLSLNNQETIPIRHDANATDITKALLALSMVNEVVVAFGRCWLLTIIVLDLFLDYCCF